jgi:hypothetical protein
MILEKKIFNSLDGKYYPYFHILGESFVESSFTRYFIMVFNIAAFLVRPFNESMHGDNLFQLHCFPCCVGRATRANFLRASNKLLNIFFKLR